MFPDTRGADVFATKVKLTAYFAVAVLDGKKDSLRIAVFCSGSAIADGPVDRGDLECDRQVQVPL